MKRTFLLSILTSVAVVAGILAAFYKPISIQQTQERIATNTAASEFATEELTTHPTAAGSDSDVADSGASPDSITLFHFAEHGSADYLDAKDAAAARLNREDVLRHIIVKLDWAAIRHFMAAGETDNGEPAGIELPLFDGKVCEITGLTFRELPSEQLLQFMGYCKDLGPVMGTVDPETGRFGGVVTTNQNNARYLFAEVTASHAAVFELDYSPTEHGPH